MPTHTLFTILPEILYAILSHLESADIVILALTHPYFYHNYARRILAHVEPTYPEVKHINLVVPILANPTPEAYRWSKTNYVRQRLHREIPALYYCERCACANIPCVEHGMEGIVRARGDGKVERIGRFLCSAEEVIIRGAE